jgi:hypothetical protein
MFKYFSGGWEIRYSGSQFWHSKKDSISWIRQKFLRSEDKGLREQEFYEWSITIVYQFVMTDLF